MPSLRAHAMRIFGAAVSSADPAVQIERLLPARLFWPTPSSSASPFDIGSTGMIDLSSCGEVFVTGAGKASAQMAAAVVRVLQNHHHKHEPLFPRCSGGFVITKDGHLDPSSEDAHLLSTAGVRVAFGGHPVPDSRGAQATTELAACLAGLQADERGRPPLVIYCVSGGGSALTCAPAGGLEMADISKTVEVLLSCGASIDEMNAVRKHITDGVQGGRVLGLVRESKAMLLSLVLSDVVGDRLDVISSGPTVPDSSTFADCRELIRRFGIAEKLPPRVFDRLGCNVVGNELAAQDAKNETPKQQQVDKKDEEGAQRSLTMMVGSNAMALAAAAHEARALGYQVTELTSQLQGEASQVGRVMAAIAKDLQAACRGEGSDKPRCVLAGGETTVTLREGAGKGGRNQELALAAALDLHVDGVDNCRVGVMRQEGQQKQHIAEPRILLMSLGTDGQDGPTDAAGAFATERTVVTAEDRMTARDHLLRNDSYSFWRNKERGRDGGLVMTGPTGTNVMDVIVVLAQR